MHREGLEWRVHERAVLDLGVRFVVGLDLDGASLVLVLFVHATPLRLQFAVFVVESGVCLFFFFKSAACLFKFDKLDTLCDERIGGVRIATLVVALALNVERVATVIFFAITVVVVVRVEIPLTLGRRRLGRQRWRRRAEGSGLGWDFVDQVGLVGKAKKPREGRECQFSEISKLCSRCSDSVAWMETEEDTPQTGHPPGRRPSRQTGRALLWASEGMVLGILGRYCDPRCRTPRSASRRRKSRAPVRTKERPLMGPRFAKRCTASLFPWTTVQHRSPSKREAYGLALDFEKLQRSTRNWDCMPGPWIEGGCVAYCICSTRDRGQTLVLSSPFFFPPNSGQKIGTALLPAKLLQVIRPGISGNIILRQEIGFAGVKLDRHVQFRYLPSFFCISPGIRSLLDPVHFPLY
ncbi:hypothetical protein DFH06DRAFT_722111 [Mycena polygramma]|nr:hypothetical protein DFH06DRAFT_722111 [Mycena polygramma]